MSHSKPKRWSAMALAAAATVLLAAPAFAGQTRDAWITAKVKFRLIGRPGIAPLMMNVDTRDGVVTLFGSVGTEDCKREAGFQAMQVAGVNVVENEMQVVSKTAMKSVAKSDGQIRDSLKTRLREPDALGDDRIAVEVANGVVRLSGDVDQAGDREIALSLVRSTQGVRSVVDDLRVTHG